LRVNDDDIFSAVTTPFDQGNPMICVIVIHYRLAAPPANQSPPFICLRLDLKLYIGSSVFTSGN